MPSTSPPLQPSRLALAFTPATQGREVYEPVSYGVLDPAAFAQSGQAYGYKGPTIAERMAMAGAIFRPADNSRIAKLGALGGWDQVRARLRGDLEGNPMLVVF